MSMCLYTEWDSEYCSDCEFGYPHQCPDRMVVVRVKFIPTSDGNVNVEIDNFLQTEDDDSVEDAPSLRGAELHTLTWNVDRTSFVLALSGKGIQSFYEFNINVDRNTSMSELFAPHVDTFLTVLPEMYKVYTAFRSSVVHAHISNFKDVKAKKNREEEILKIWRPKINRSEERRVG